MPSITEGKAKIKVGSAAFYNPKMKGLRDLSVLYLKGIGAKKKSLLDATSATGIRGIRYRLEAGVGSMTLLDINKKAWKSTNSNLKKNKVKGKSFNESIQEFCNSTHEHFDCIDLDPFGSAAPYVYDLLKVATDGTTIMITGTDTAVLCGASPLACYKVYGAMPMHNELCHEAGIRILINFVAKLAAQFNFGIEIKLAVANLHYMRIFVVLRHGAKAAVESVRQTGFAGACSKCRAFSYSKGLVPKLGKKCSNCGTELQLFGPLWLGSIKDGGLVREMSINMPKGMDNDAMKLLRKLDEELDMPFFYSISKITRQLGIGSVPQTRVLDLLKKKYSASLTHFDLDGIKTDAPIKYVIDCVKKSKK